MRITASRDAAFPEPDSTGFGPWIKSAAPEFLSACHQAPSHMDQVLGSADIRVNAVCANPASICATADFARNFTADFTGDFEGLQSKPSRRAVASSKLRSRSSTSPSAFATIAR